MLRHAELYAMHYHTFYQLNKWSQKRAMRYFSLPVHSVEKKICIKLSPRTNGQIICLHKQRRHETSAEHLKLGS